MAQRRRTGSRRSLQDVGRRGRRRAGSETGEARRRLERMRHGIITRPEARTQLSKHFFLSGSGFRWLACTKISMCTYVCEELMLEVSFTNS